MSITAPTLGVVVGGYILDKYGGPPDGGYTGAYVKKLCLNITILLKYLCIFYIYKGFRYMLL